MTIHVVSQLIKEQNVTKNALLCFASQYWPNYQPSQRMFFFIPLHYWPRLLIPQLNTRSSSSRNFKLTSSSRHVKSFLLSMTYLLVKPFALYYIVLPVLFDLFVVSAILFGVLPAGVFFQLSVVCFLPGGSVLLLPFILTLYWYEAIKG